MGTSRPSTPTERASGGSHRFEGTIPTGRRRGQKSPLTGRRRGGTEILYLDDHEGFRIVNLDGSESKAIAPGGIGGASWSPDGSKIVVSKAVGDISGGTVEFSSTLSLLDLNGGRPQRQIFGPVTDLIDDPAWSPRGGQIAFSDFASINLVNTDGSGLQPIYRFRGGVGGGEPAWSPDGTQMVIEDGGDLYVIDAKSGDARQLTNISAAGGFDSCPDWSSDGQIAFSRSVGADRATRSAIFIINSDGSGGHRLTQTEEP